MIHKLGLNYLIFNYFILIYIYIYTQICMIIIIIIYIYIYPVSCTIETFNKVNQMI